MVFGFPVWPVRTETARLIGMKPQFKKEIKASYRLIMNPFSRNAPSPVVHCADTESYTVSPFVRRV